MKLQRLLVALTVVNIVLGSRPTPCMSNILPSSDY
jgi:hypothetical protein